MQAHPDTSQSPYFLIPFVTVRNFSPGRRVPPFEERDPYRDGPSCLCGHLVHDPVGVHPRRRHGRLQEVRTRTTATDREEEGLGAKNHGDGLQADDDDSAPSKAQWRPRSSISSRLHIHPPPFPPHLFLPNPTFSLLSALQDSDSHRHGRAVGLHGHVLADPAASLHHLRGAQVGRAGGERGGGKATCAGTFPGLDGPVAAHLRKMRFSQQAC